MNEKQQKTNMNKIEKNEAKSLVDRLGPHIDDKYDYTGDIIYPATREDICAVRRMAENGSNYGYDTIYLLWKNKSGLNHKELINSKTTKDYINIAQVVETEEHIQIKIKSGGSYSGKAWEKTFEEKKSELKLG